MRWLWLRLLLLVSMMAAASGLSGQAAGSSPQSNSSQDSSSQNASSPAAAPSESKPAKAQGPDLSPPRSDRVNANDLGSNVGESSSKDTLIDLSPPENDAKAHPKSAEAIGDAEAATRGAGDGGAFHPWDPHKAAKSVEAGDYYFVRKTCKAPEDPYGEAVYDKQDDAVATCRLVVYLKKRNRPVDALAEYERYLSFL